MTDNTNSLDLSPTTRKAMDKLAPEHRERLLALIESAAAAQRHSLENASEDALAILPAPFRKRLLRMLMR